MANNAIEEKIDHLTDQIENLTKQLSMQHERLMSIEMAWSGQTVESFIGFSPFGGSRQRGVLDNDIESGGTPGAGSRSSLAGSGSFLAKLATICFVLVIALVLRTFADSGVIALKTGSIVGTAYAAFLIAMGWRLISKKHRLGTIFPVCGAFLMFALVLETHGRFTTYTTVTAYTILVCTMLPMAIMGKRYKRLLFYGVGVIGATFTAIAIDFPSPSFSYLALFLFAANIIAFSFESKQTKVLQTFLYTITILFWFLWAYGLYGCLIEATKILPPTLGLTWFLPVTLVSIFTLMGISVYRSFRGGDTYTALDVVLPTVNVLWLYPVCSLVVVPWLGYEHLFGYAGLVLALLHFAVAVIIFRSSRHGGAGICAYVFAGSVIMVMGALFAVENVLFVLPFIGVVAVMLSFASQACEIGGIRLASYLLQCVAMIFGLTYGVFLPGTSTSILAIVVAGSLCLMSAFQYHWSRSHPISCSVGFFAWIDPKDYSAIVLLFAALINGFCMLQLIAYEFLVASVTDPANALLGTQSIFINLGAMGLLIVGLLKKNREILYTAIGVVCLGALKAIGYDLFRVEGLSRVLSVFFFGANAAVGSVVLSRWSQPRHFEETTIK